MINLHQTVNYQGRSYQVGEIINKFRQSWTINGNPSVYQPISNQITELKQIIKESVTKAYKPSVNRALKLHQDNETREQHKQIETNKKLAKDKCQGILEEELYNLVKSPIYPANLQNFLNLEKVITEHISRVFKEEFGITNYTYGNAQKWFTISLKYLLSSSNLPQQCNKLFLVAPAPIDRIVINKAHKMFKIKKPSTSWSKIDDFNEIRDFELSLAIHAKQNNFISPLIWEILTWSVN